LYLQINYNKKWNILIDDSYEPNISILIPAHNEEDNIELIFQTLVPVLKQINQSWEIIFADDGSKDKSFELVKKIHEQNPGVTGISLSRNFGHQIALLGMQRAKVRYYDGCRLQILRNLTAEAYARARYSQRGSMQRIPDVQKFSSKALPLINLCRRSYCRIII
jgi:cellulose synthase/poly-beta-1,6-N-acetylglucosamine synthase-like glycosyltransferase